MVQQQATDDRPDRDRDRDRDGDSDATGPDADRPGALTLTALLRVIQDGQAPGGLLHGRLDLLEDMLARATARGEHVHLSALDLVDIVLLPIYATRLLASEPLTPDLAHRLVDRFLTLNDPGST